jgi:hypothetical protein
MPGILLPKPLGESEGQLAADILPARDWLCMLPIPPSRTMLALTPNAQGVSGYDPCRMLHDRDARLLDLSPNKPPPVPFCCKVNRGGIYESSRQRL